MRRGFRVRVIVIEGEVVEMVYFGYIKRNKIRNGFLRVCVIIKNGKIFYFIFIF